MVIKEFEYGFEKIVRMVVSQPINKQDVGKLIFRFFMKDNAVWVQEEKIVDKKAYHNNFLYKDFMTYFENEIVKRYKQVLIVCEGKDVSYFISPNGKVKRSEQTNNVRVGMAQHNREKDYILKEGEAIPALVDLGIFTKEYKVVASMYDKFKQINRFVEIIDDQVKLFDEKEIIILDFGCGKSYLTFILYYYFNFKKQINAKIIGYDLKADVVDKCNQIAKKYSYNNLRFEVKDVSKGIDNQKVDMMITLHACDTATDYALDYAIRNNIKYVFSVPCCQHQINATINKGGDLDLLIKDGLIKERVSALLTDSIRAEILRQNGYIVDVLEFVNFAHSPKNIMLRACKVKNGKRDFSQIEILVTKYGFEQELFKLQNKDI